MEQPEQPKPVSIDPAMRTLSKRMISALVAQEQAGGEKTGHFQGVEMRVEDLIDEDLIDEDLVMYLRIKNFPGHTFPTREEFFAYTRPINESTNQTRQKFSAYLANLYSILSVDRELAKLDELIGGETEK